METKLQFKLERPAKSSGGDRYAHGKKGDGMFMTVYIPQSISRDGEKTINEFEMTLRPVS